MPEKHKMSCIGANLMLSQLFSREHLQSESIFRANRGLTYVEYCFPEDSGISMTDARYSQSQEYLDLLSVNCCFEKARMFVSMKAWDEALKSLYRATTYSDLSKKNKAYFLLLRVECNLGLSNFDECLRDLQDCERILLEFATIKTEERGENSEKDGSDRTITTTGSDIDKELLNWLLNEQKYLQSRLQYALYKYDRDKKIVAKKMMSAAT